MFKRLLSMMLVVIMLTGLLPVEVYAAQKNPETKMDPGDVTIEGTNGFGTLLSAELEEEIDQTTGAPENEINYSVTGLTIEGNTATVEYSSQEDAVLVVALYTEDGLQMLASGRTAVSAEDTTVNVTIEGEIPQYFQAQAYLMDNYDLSPLCAAYHTPLYTRAMQELLASTVEDYDADRILNLDENKDTNFAVYAEDTILLETGDRTNVLRSAEDNVYVIEHADDTVTSLKKGDVFVHALSVEEVLIVKVAEISVDGTTVTITGSDDLAMEEVFEAVKIEGESTTSDIIVDDSTADEGITYLGEVSDDNISTYALEDEKPITASHKFALSIKGKSPDGPVSAQISLTGSIGLKLDGVVKYYLSLTEHYLEFKLTPTFDTRITVEGKIIVSHKMGQLDVPIVPTVTVGLEPTLMAEFSGKVVLRATIGMTLGFQHDDKNGQQNLSSKPFIDPELYLEGTIFIGVDLKPNLKVLDITKGEAPTLKLTLKALVGGRIKGRQTGNGHVLYEKDAQSYHLCEDCIDYTLQGYAKLEGEMSILKQKWLTFRITFGEWTIDLGGFYYSKDNHKLDFDSCPNYTYRVTVCLNDQYGRPFSNGTIHVSTLSDPLVTDENGVAVFYTPSDLITLQAREQGMSVYKDLRVDCPVRLNLNLKPYDKPEDSDPGSGEDEPIVIIPEGGIFGEIETEDFIDHGEPVDHGRCGKDAWWALYADGLLKIYGTGEMYSFYDDYAYDDYHIDIPWADYREMITSIIVDDGITSIGDLAFWYCSVLTKVHLADSVTQIGFDAFYQCSSLKSINIPDGVTHISSSLFEHCSSLTEIHLPDSVEDISSYAFSGCTSLATVSLGSGMTYIGTNAFRNCSSLTEINLPSGMTYISDNAFKGCTSLKEIIVPDSVTDIGEDVFTGCSSLEYVSLPFIGEEAEDSAQSSFGYFFGTESYTGGTAVTQATYGTYYIPASLRSVRIAGGDVALDAFRNFSMLTEVTLGDDVTSIGITAFYGCSALTKVSVGNGVAAIGNSAFNGCSALTEVSIGSGVSSIGHYAFNLCSNLARVSLSGNVTFIGDYAFYGCHSLTGLSLGNSLTSIGEAAFQFCNKLAAVDLPDSVTFIGNYAFAGCKGLTEMKIPHGVTQLNEAVFQNCSNLTSVVLPDSVTSIGNYAFMFCQNLRAITLGNQITSIGTGSFNYCIGLTNIVLPDSVTLIDEGAFRSCTALFSITLGSNIKYIYSYAFEDCGMLTHVNYKGTRSQWDAIYIGRNNEDLDLTYRSFCGPNMKWRLYDDGTLLIHGSGEMYDYTMDTSPWYTYRSRITSVVIEDGVTSIGDYAFYYCSGLKEIPLPDSLTKIGDSAFRNTGLISVDLPDSVTSIGKKTFCNCRYLTEASLSAGLTTIGEGAFWYCDALTTVGLPEGLVTIGAEAFYRCDLTEIILPSSLTYIGEDAFSDCTPREVRYNGTSEQWEAVYVGDGNEALAALSTQSMGWVLSDDGVLTISGTGNMKDFEDSPWDHLEISKVIIEDGVTSIGDYAFEGCSFQEILIPDSVVSIGDYAFESCAVQKIDIPDSVTAIGEYAFKYCYAMEEIGLSAGMTEIAPHTFDSCKKLTSIVIPTNITAIGEYAFYECDSLTEVAINGAASIGNSAFEYCSDLTTVHLGEGLISLGAHAFDDCASLTSIAIPEGAESIGDYAFSFCDHLAEVTLPKSLSVIGIEAFQYCYDLERVYYNGSNLQWREIDMTYGNDNLNSHLICATEEEAVPNFEWDLDSNGQLTIRGQGPMTNFDGDAPWYGKWKKITSVVIEDGITSIGNDAFEGCNALTAVSIPDSVTSIGSYAFANCTKLSAISIPDSVTSIGDYAFNNCRGLEEIVIGDGVASIGNYAFNDCRSLREISIPDSVSVLGSYAFWYCASLVRVSMGEGITELLPHTFAHCTALTTISIGNSVECIGAYAFFDCVSLTSIYIPVSVSQIELYAFYRCGSLQNICYGGTEEQWNEIEIRNGSNDDTLTNAANYTYSGRPSSVGILDSGLCGENVRWTLYSNGVLEISGTGGMDDYDYNTPMPWFDHKDQIISVIIEEGVTTIGERAFYECENLVNVVIPDSLTSIGSWAFESCTNLKHADITYISGLTSIGKSAFSFCQKLTDVRFPKRLVSIGNFAFSYCALSYIQLPPSVTSIGEGAFYECRKMSWAELPENITTIAKSTFAACSELQEIEIPAGVTSIGHSAFWDCTNLRYVDIPDSVMTIEMSAFAWCSSLEEIDIPSGVTEICEYTFADCTSLAGIALGSGITSIGDDAFDGCTSLKEVYYDGTAEQWNAIEIGKNNEPLLAAYGSMAAAEVSDAAEDAAEENTMPEASADAEPVTIVETFLSGITPFAVYPGDYTTEVEDGQTLKTASFEGLVPGKEYIMLALQTLDTEDILSAENLLYICQGTAEADGTLSFRYMQRAAVTRSYVMACGASNKDLNDGEITFPDMIGDGTLHVIDPVVTYDGKVLTEGKDYVITGAVDYSKSGTYVCYIRGIYNYTGQVKCTYTVLPADYVVTFDPALSAFSLTNKTGETADIEFMAAAYDRNGCMIVSDSFTRSLTDGESVEWQLTCPEAAEVRRIRAFVLDPDTMQPLCVEKSWTVQAVR